MAITINPRALDPDVLIDGARAQLLTNATVVTDTAIPNTDPVRYGIYTEIAPEGSPAPFIVLSLPSVVFESSYNLPAINALLDVSCYTEGNSTTVVRALARACLAALIDSPWAIAGMTTISANMEEAGAGFRSLTTASNGVITRGRQFTLRVRALKN